jgi:hypothetical protein
LRVIEGKDNFDSIQPRIAHETNRAFRHFKIEGFVGVVGPIRNALKVNPRLGISQKRFHIQKNQRLSKSGLYDFTQEQASA